MFLVLCEQNVSLKERHINQTMKSESCSVVIPSDKMSASEALDPSEMQLSSTAGCVIGFFGDTGLSYKQLIPFKSLLHLTLSNCEFVFGTEAELGCRTEFSGAFDN